jgi:hypothetical protein
MCRSCSLASSAVAVASLNNITNKYVPELEIIA